MRKANKRRYFINPMGFAGDVRYVLLHNNKVLFCVDSIGVARKCYWSLRTLWILLRDGQTIREVSEEEALKHDVFLRT